MESLSLFKLSRSLEIFPNGLFTTTELFKLFPNASQNTLYARLKRLKQAEAVTELKNGFYLLSSKNPSSFEIANFLHSPSYVSFESALSTHGIITGFPYQITSATTDKSLKIESDGKSFAYHHVSPRFFFGFEKFGAYLIADREKALLDYLYFAFKGLRSKDLSEFDLTEINKTKIKKYLKIINNARFASFVKKLIC